MNNSLTIFTPTYNRAHLLPRLYDSLVNQTNKSFLWLVIDDGSSDNTEELINSLKNENKIKIKYVKKSNGGKNTTINFAHEIIDTDYYTCVDSDDMLSIDAVDILQSYMNDCYGDSEIIGIVGRRCNVNNEPFSNNWPKENKKLFFNELSKVYSYKTDTILVFKTNMVSKYKFPIIKNERFITESILYNQFLYSFKLFAIKECIYIGEYQNDGYTVQGLNLFFKNPVGFLLSLKQNAFLSEKYSKNIIEKVKKSANYYGWRKVLKITEIKDENFQYNIPFFYKMMGKLTSLFLINKYKKMYTKWKKNSKGR